MSKKMKTTTALLVLIVLMLTVILSLYLTDGWTDGNKYCLKGLGGHKYDDNGICIRCGVEKPVEDTDKPSVDESAEADVHGGLVVNIADTNNMDVDVMPLAGSDLVSVAESSNSYVLSVTIKPSYATDRNVDWNIHWKNAQSEFANGKSVTDYCTLTPDPEDSTKATLRCLKAFGEQIEVVATSRDNSDITATCNVDYVQKITGFTFNMPDWESNINTFTYEIETSVYTIPSEITFNTGGSCALTSGFCNALKSSAPTPDFIFEVTNLDTDLINKTLTLSLDSVSSGSDRTIIGSFIYVNENVFYYDFNDDPSVFVDWFVSTAKSYSGAHIYFKMTYSATYNGVTYSSGTKTIESRLDGQALHIPVTDMTMNTGGVLF